jgi:hypothetical protein
MKRNQNMRFLAKILNQFPVCESQKKYDFTPKCKFSNAIGSDTLEAFENVEPSLK